MKEFLNKILLVLLVMAPTLGFGFMGRPTEMLISLFAGFTSAVMLNMDKFESFKAGQLEAKLQKTEKAIEEANATIEQLNSVAIPLLKTNLSFLLYEGTFDGMPADEQEMTFYELLKIKESLDLSDTDKYFTEAAKGVTSHYFSNMYHEISKTHDGFKINYNKYTTTNYAPETPSVSELRSFFDRNPEFLIGDVKNTFEKFEKIKIEFIEE